MQEKKRFHFTKYLFRAKSRVSIPFAHTHSARAVGIQAWLPLFSPFFWLKSHGAVAAGRSLGASRRWTQLLRGHQLQGLGTKRGRAQPPPPPPQQDTAASAYGRKGEEGDADERERSCQQPPVPGLRVLVPVADGGESNLQGGDRRRALGQPALKPNQHGQNSHNTGAGRGGARVTTWLELTKSRCSSGTQEHPPAFWDGHQHGTRRCPDSRASAATLPARHTAVFTPAGSVFLPFADTESAAIWCRGLRQLGASPGRRGCAFSRESEPAQFPPTPFWHLREEGRAICMHKDLVLFIPHLPSTAY